MSRENLLNAQKSKKDEFYTQYDDIQNLRQFDERQKRIAYENQKGICPICKKHFEIDEMEGDHIVHWSKGGETLQENCQMLCKNCNRHKSDK